MIGRVLLALAAVAAPTKLPPIDECAADPTFAKFRAGLIAAADKHDMDAVVRALDGEVLNDFGGTSGKAAFREKWTAKDVDLWSELKEVLTLGCAFEDGVAIAPSLSAQLDPESDDIYEAAIAKPGATLRSKPEGGDLLAILKWDLVTVDGSSISGDSAEVKLRDGRTGYVKSSELRMAADYRLTMEKRGGNWRITAFVEGD